MAEHEALGAQLAALELSLGGASQMASVFDAELKRMQENLVFTGREVGQLSNGIGGGLRRAFDGLIFDGMKLSEALRQVARSMVDTAYGVAMRPVQTALGGGRGAGLEWADVGGLALCPGRELRAGQGDALCPRWRGDGADALPDARRQRADGRGRSRGDLAACTRRGWAAGRQRRGGGATGAGGDAYRHAGRRRVPPQPEPDRRAVGPRAEPWSEKRVKHGIS